MIYVVRHGESEWNKIGRIAGRIDVSLDEKGIEQAKATAQKFKNINFDVVISSPLKRTLQTAKILTSKPVQIDDRIIERDNGILEGMFKSEIPIDVDFNSDSANYGIENITDFRHRIYDFWSDILKKYAGKNVLVVTHAGITIYTRCFFEGEPQDNDYEALKLQNCEILTFEN